MRLIFCSTFKQRCDKNANATECLGRARWKRVGCDCQCFGWSAIILKIVLMVLHELWSAIAYVEATTAAVLVVRQAVAVKTLYKIMLLALRLVRIASQMMAVVISIRLALAVRLDYSRTVLRPIAIIIKSVVIPFGAEEITTRKIIGE